MRDALDEILQRGCGVLDGAPGHADARVDWMRTLGYEVAEARSSVSVLDERRLGVGLRLVKNCREAFVAREGDIDWIGCLRDAAELADCGAPAESGAGSLGGAGSERTGASADGDAESDLPPPEWIQDVRSALRKRMAALALSRLTFSARTGWRGIARSDGMRALRRECNLFLAAECRLPGGRVNRPRTVSLACGSATDVTDIEQRLQLVIDQAADMASRPTAPLRGGDVGPVVLAPGVAGLLIHEALGHPSEADRAPGTHRAKLRLGLAVGPPSLGVIDRADIAGCRGALPFDDEGTVCKPATLVAEGRWVGLLHTRRTAREDGVAPTGNARTTSFLHPPLSRMRVTEVLPGVLTADDLLGDSEGGLYLDWPQSASLRGNLCEIRAFAWSIRNGRIAEAAGPVVLHAYPLSGLEAIDGVASDRTLLDSHPGCTRGAQKRLAVALIAPTIRLRRATVQPVP